MPGPVAESVGEDMSARQFQGSQCPGPSCTLWTLIPSPAVLLGALGGPLGTFWALLVESWALSAKRRDQHGGNITSKWFQVGSKMEPTWLLNGVWRGPGEALEASWGSLGALQGAWSAKGGFQEAYGSLWEAS